MEAGGTQQKAATVKAKENPKTTANQSQTDTTEARRSDSLQGEHRDTKSEGVYTETQERDHWTDSPTKPIKRSQNTTDTSGQTAATKRATGASRVRQSLSKAMDPPEELAAPQAQAGPHQWVLRYQSRPSLVRRKFPESRSNLLSRAISATLAGTAP
jgi:hypothetical protein